MKSEALLVALLAASQAEDASLEVSEIAAEAPCFDAGAQQHGRVVSGALEIRFATEDEELEVIIVDRASGGETIIQMPAPGDFRDHNFGCTDSNSSSD